MELRNRIDALFARFWGNIVDRLCTATGKSNYFWAKAILLLGTIVYFICPRSLVPFRIFAVLIWVPETWRHTSGLERKSESSDVLPHEAYQLAQWRVFAALVAVTDGPVLGSWSSSAFYLCISAARYFATHHNPGGKSWAKRAVEWLRSIQLPLLSPRSALGGA